MATELTVEVGNGLSAWNHDDTTLAAGTHTVDVTRRPDLEQAIAAAVAAGVLTPVEGEPAAGAVETDDASLARYQAAQAARAPLYDDRDRELAQAAPDEREAVLEAWEDRMAAAAQQALEDQEAQ